MLPRFMLLSLLIILTGCNIVTMNYVPTIKTIESRLPEFIQDTSSVEGLYGYSDVDAMIFRYSIPSGNSCSIESTLVRMEQTAISKGWKVIDKKPIYQTQYAIYTTLYSIRLNRYGPSGAFYSSEEVRVVAIPEQAKLSKIKPKIYVAWVQTDSPNKVDKIENTSEWAWATKTLWPKLDAYIAKESELVEPTTLKK
ncbi:MAG: hypothetical protein ACE14V_16645 [bacterium]